MTHALPIHHDPGDGESAISYVENLAAANFLPLRAVLEVISPNHVPWGWDDDAWSRLAALSRVTPDRLAPMRRPSAGILARPDAILLLGRPIRPGHVHTRSLRVCPACLAERRVIPEAWNLAHAPACLRHGVLLRETCDCGAPLAVIHRGPKPFTCRCGRPFAELSTSTASLEILRGTAWLSSRLADGLADAQEPPAPFRDLQLDDLSAVIDLVGLAACTPAEEDRHFHSHRSGFKRGDSRGRRDVATAARQTAAAARVMAGWPEAYYAVLDDVVHRAGADRPFATSVGRLLVKPYLGLRGHTMPCLDDAMDGFLTSRGMPRQRNAGLKQRNGVFRQVLLHRTRKNLAAQVGQKSNGNDFTLVLKETLAAFDNHRHERLEDLGEAFTQAFQMLWADHVSTMSMAAASLILDHPRIARDMTPWIHPELLTARPDATARHARRGSDSFRCADVADLRRRLGEVAVRVEAPPIGHVPYSPKVKTLYGGGYTKTGFLLDVYAGRIRTASLVDRPHLSDLLFHHGDGLDRSWSTRIVAMEDEDRFWIKHRIVQVMRSLWPSLVGRGVAEGTNFWHGVRNDGLVRTRTLVNRTEGRERPMYHYSLNDCLRRAAARYGTSVSPSVDAWLTMEVPSRAS